MNKKKLLTNNIYESSSFKAFFKKKWLIIKKEFTSEPPKDLIINSLIVILGALIYAFGTSFFIVPLNLITGGISSMAIILHKYINLEIDTLILIVSWSFFIFGFFALGIKYSLRALLFTISSPLFIMMFNFLIENTYIDGRQVLNILEVENIVVSSSFTIQGDGIKALAYVASSIIGGALLGVGVGFAIKGGGSSGGTDVVNLLVRKYFNIKVGITSFVQDLIIITIGFFVNDLNILASCFGIIATILCSILIDKVSFGSNQYFVAFISSNKWPEINAKIAQDVIRGTTLISAKGGYSRVDTYLIEVCFDKRDLPVIKSIVLKIDPNAFISVMKASEIIGYGFTRKTPKVEDYSSLDVSTYEKDLMLLKANREKNNGKENKSI